MPLSKPFFCLQSGTNYAPDVELKMLRSIRAEHIFISVKQQAPNRGNVKNIPTFSFRLYGHIWLIKHSFFVDSKLKAIIRLPIHTPH